MKDILNFLIEKDIHILLIYIIIGIIIYQIIKHVITKKNNKKTKKRQETIKKLLLNIIKYVIMILIAIKVLGILGVNITSILAGLGIASVVLGLALQDMMKDILVGISIILEDQFDIGDYVLINNFEGTVVDLGLKNTKILNYENVLKIIANRTITEVTNYSKTNPNVIMDIPFSYEISNEKADKVVENIINRIKKEIDVLTGEVSLWGLNKFVDSYLEYRIEVPVKPEEQFKVKRQINRIIKEEFDKEKLSIPYNIIEVKNG